MKIELNAAARLLSTVDDLIARAEHEVDLQRGSLRKAEERLKKNPSSKLCQHQVTREKKLLSDREAFLTQTQEKK